MAGTRQKYYFDIETYSPGARPNPETDKIITIQYQPLDWTTGKATGELEILKEWESKEMEIIAKIAPLIKKWEFIPVGHNLFFERRFLSVRASRYQISLPLDNLTYDLPCIDIHPVFIILNKGDFKGSGMHRHTKKLQDGSCIRPLYEREDYAAIEDYIRNEAEAFVEFYSELCEKLPVYFKGKE